MITRAETTTITSIEHARHAIGSRRFALAILSVAVTLGASVACGRAEVSIQADRAVVHLEASKAPLSEVLSALESKFSIRHRTSVPLDQSISGTYRGSVRHVLSRLLGGFNYYIVDTAEGGVEITVVGRPGAAAAGNLPRAGLAAPQMMTMSQRLVVPPPTAAEVAAERQRAHHRRPP
jgi:hypothetical protein